MEKLLKNWQAEQKSQVAALVVARSVAGGKLACVEIRQ